MKKMKKKIVSGLLAVAMMFGVVPQGIAPVSASGLTIEEAYFQVLDDAINARGIASQIEYGLGEGLTYAKMIDFNKDGVEELFFLYVVGGNYAEFHLEIWEYRDGAAHRLLQDNFSAYSSRDGIGLQLETLENGMLQLHCMTSASSAAYLYLADCFWTFSSGTYESLWFDYFLQNPSGTQVEVDTVECKINEQVVSEDSFNSKKEPLEKVTDVVDIAGHWNMTAYQDEIDVDLYYQLKYSPLKAEELKELLPYTGYLDKMYLSPEQAIAMAEEIEGYYQEGSVGMWVALFDSGTGVPGMWLLNSRTSRYDDWLQHEKKYDSYSQDWVYYFTGDNNNELYFWDEGSNRLNNFERPTEGWSDTLLLSEGALIYPGSDMSCGGDTTIFRVYDITGGVNHGITDYRMSFMEWYSENYTDSELKQAITDSANGYLAQHGLGTVAINLDHFEVSDVGDGFYAYGVIENGASILYDYTDTGLYSQVYDNADSSLTVSTYDSCSTTGNWADGKEVATLLRDYAEKAQFRFKFPEFSQEPTVTNLFSNLNLSGTMVECYEIASNFYYVIMEENGVEKGFIIRAVKENGAVMYKIFQENLDILEENQLLLEANNYINNSNILLNFEELKNLNSATAYVSYFNTALQNITGIALNDSGKSDLAQSMQDSIANFSTFFINASGETGEIYGEQISSQVDKSRELYDAFMTLLSNSGEELNKELELCVRVVVEDLNESNWTIYLDSELIGGLKGNNLQVYLTAGNQGLEFSADDLDAILKTHGGLFVNVQETGSEQYSITFADVDGNAIEKLDNPVKIFLPTTNEFATIMLEYAQGTENWGGQFNASTNTIQFSTIHSGTYVIMDNSVEIPDVSGDNLSMVQFMVSKGFFELDENGNFNPQGELSRNDFTKTLVSMFFALDHDLQTSFSDVSTDSPYYAYISSGESRGIISGYDDGMFHGENIMTEEMAFTLIAQTLVDKKGYIYPEDTDSYLNPRLNPSDYSDWAKGGIALSFRDGIVLAQEEVTPVGNISREDAAVYLYRLFMLLEEKQQVSFDLAEKMSLEEGNGEKFGFSPLVWSIITMAGLTVLGGGGFATYQYSKKKKV